MLFICFAVDSCRRQINSCDSIKHQFTLSHLNLTIVARGAKTNVYMSLVLWLDIHRIQWNCTNFSIVQIRVELSIIISFHLCCVFHIRALCFEKQKSKIDSCQKTVYNCCFGLSYITVVININLRAIVLDWSWILLILSQAPACTTTSYSYILLQFSEPMPNVTMFAQHSFSNQYPCSAI